MKENNYQIITILLCLLFILNACNDADKTPNSVTPVKKEKVKTTETPIHTERGPVINITDTLSIKRTLLILKDSAATLDGMTIKLQEIYAVKLPAFIKKNNLKITGAPVAWFKGQKAPYFFEAGLPINKKPIKLSNGIKLKEIGTDSVVIAHFFGPYNLIPQAYDALKEWVKDHKKKTTVAPYEVYIDDPIDASGKLKDPYKVQTDIVFSWK